MPPWVDTMTGIGARIGTTAEPCDESTASDPDQGRPSPDNDEFTAASTLPDTSSPRR